MKPVSIITAFSQNRVIGKDNGIPWRIPSDFKNFRKITSGHTVLMGRKTFDSIGKPLPNRRNIVITSQKDWEYEGVEVVHSIEEALSIFDDDMENFILGGSGIYEAFLPHTQKFYISHVLDLGRVQGDTFFPEYDFSGMRVVEDEVVKEEKDEYGYHFVVYQKHLSRCP